MCFTDKENCFLVIFIIYALGALEFGFRLFEFIYIANNMKFFSCILFIILISWVVVFIFTTILFVGVILKNPKMVSAYCWVALVFGTLLCIMQIVTYAIVPRKYIVESKYEIDFLIMATWPCYFLFWVSFVFYPFAYLVGELW